MDDQPQKYHKFSRWVRGDAHQIEITSRVLTILHKLFIHGALSSDMLHQLVAPIIKSKGFTERLKLMYRNPNALIDRPAHQRGVYNANYRPLTYSITPKGIQVLKDFGRVTEQECTWRERLSFKTDAHDTMAAYITASIEIGATQAGCQFIPWTEILGHEKCPEATKTAKRPFEIPIGEASIIPDAMFGIKGDAYVFFALEADRHTEPIETHELKRTSYAGKLNLYRQLFKDSIYQKQFGIPNMLMLTVTISDLHMRKIMDYFGRTHKNGLKPFCFKAVPELNPYTNNPPATGHLFTLPWPRIGAEDFHMFQ